MSLATRMAQAGQSRRQQPLIQPKPLPAPTGGLVTSQNVGAMEPGTAIVLTNWVPTRTGIRVRGGNTLYATLGGTVESLIAYVGTTDRELFGGAGGSIYPLTNVVDPITPPTPAVTGQGNNYYSSVNFPVTGGNYLYAVNGLDDAQLYDGTTWQAVTAVSVPIAITGIATSLFSHVNTYRNRLYFTEVNSLNLWYLGVDSVGGVAAVLSLSGIFQKGGSILFSATWSSESGANAMEAYLVVMSTEGEVAVFTGSFPGGSDWAFVNVYDISKPLGRNGWFRAGGDIIIATEMGLVPVSAARMKDPAALGLDAISVKIEPTWKAEANRRRTIPWQIAKWDENDMYLVNVPVTSPGQEAMTIVGNLKTGAISLFSGWDNRCFAVHNRQLYFGANDGTVRLAEVGGTDNGLPYTAQAAFAWDHLGTPGFKKAMKQAKAVFQSDKPFAYRLSASVDYNQLFPIPPNALPDTQPDSLWDVGEFDVALWDAGTSLFTTTTRQRSIGKTGEVFSMELQVPVNSVNTPRVELVLMFHTTSQGAYGV